MSRFTFIGGTKRGYELLKALIEKNYLPVFAVILKEDDQEPEKYSLKITELLKSCNITFQIRKKLTDDDYNEIKNSNSDFALVLGWRTLINTDPDLNLKYGFIASHFSLLPKYRGFAPVQWAIINGETESGVTLFRIGDGEIDSGEIISQAKIAISSDNQGFDVDKKMTKAAIELIMNFFEDIRSDTLKFKVQDERISTYTCRRIPEDGRINWSCSSLEIHNLIRAVAFPYPGAFCYFNNEKYLINKAKVGDLNNKVYSGRIPGRVIKMDEEGAEVLCGSGTIKILEWKNSEDGTVSNPCSQIKSITATLK
ncbi:MAG TPA: methionyl-tRNA formyltransferase [Ignavibacteria bacterium]|nr:methionyl-tRNA formyltransferase [Ignavibacteria bacterium]